MLVQVRDNNIDQALKVLKKKMQREGVFREMRLRECFEKPSEARVRREAEGRGRLKKALRKQSDRDNGIVAKPKGAGRPAR